VALGDGLGDLSGCSCLLNENDGVDGYGGHDEHADGQGNHLRHHPARW